VTYPTRDRLVSNHVAATKEAPLTCNYVMICQSRNGDEESSYLSVICSEMIIKNALRRDAGR